MYSKPSSASSPGPSCSTACSSGYVSADDEHGLSYGRGRESVYSETSSIASPESYPDTPSGTPSPGFGLGQFSWAPSGNSYDTCSNFDGVDVFQPDMWSALDFGSNHNDAWFGSDIQCKGSFDPEGSNLVGDRSILKDLLVHTDNPCLQGSPPQPIGSWPSRLDSPVNLNGSFIMDYTENVMEKPLVKTELQQGLCADSYSKSTTSAITLFQQIFADGILEPTSTVSDGFVSVSQIKKEPGVEDSLPFMGKNSHEKGGISSNSYSKLRPTTPTVNNGNKSHHRTSSHYLPKVQLHKSIEHKLAHMTPDRKPIIKSESCVFASQNDHTYTSKVALVNSKSSTHLARGVQVTPRRWNSILEYFLLTKRSHDPQKGSDAALASEGIFTAEPAVDNMEQQQLDWQQQQQSPPPQLLKKLLTGEMDQTQQLTDAADENQLVDAEHQLQSQQTCIVPTVFGDNFSLECDFDLGSTDFTENLLASSEIADLDTMWEDPQNKVKTFYYSFLIAHCILIVC